MPSATGASLSSSTGPWGTKVDAMPKAPGLVGELAGEVQARERIGAGENVEI
nr:hypothetical protein [Tanacetum cinerariifolium]